MKRLILIPIIVNLINSYLFAQSAQEILAQNECMKCHSIRRMKYAPPFSMIVKMNSGWFGLPQSDIKNSIKNGSQGKYPMFSNNSMPAYKNLTDKELDILMDWIKSQNEKGMRNNTMHHHKLK